ncbi:MAG: hypothetical protein LBM64_03000 [Deltaproteobacteria bacterium]|jgi:hypothetical protein|nr:hypothetical protein [Deltaproteobacteria bacterium]
MMKTIRLRVLPLFLGLLAFCPGFPAAPERAEALSEMARQRLTAANPEFAAAETALDQAWEKLARALPRPAVEPYLENLLHWRNQGRDQAVRAVYANFLDNPTALPSTLLDGQGLPALAAVYARVSLERVKLMDMAAAQFRDDKLSLVIPGWVDRVGERGEAGAYYTLTPYGWVTPLQIGTEKDLDGLPSAVRERIIALPDSDYDTIAILKGRIDDQLRGFNLQAGLALENTAGMGWVEWDSWAEVPKADESPMAE